MTNWSKRRTETIVAASPVWILLRDTFTGGPPVDRVAVSLERLAGTTWVPFAHRHQLSLSGDLVFLNLGRTRDPGAVGTFDVRVTATVPGSISEASNGDPALTTTIAAWAPDAPVVPAMPDDLRFFPGPGYRFPGGTPLLAGQVLDSNGNPAPRARVWATATVQNASLTEEVRCDDEGRFRLPLRWFAGAVDIHATAGAESGSILIFAPAALSSTHQITLI